MSAEHTTVALQVWADVDAGIADLVGWLNTIPGIRTFASCQGRCGYAPYVGITWRDDDALAVVRTRCFLALSPGYDHWGYVHPNFGETSE